MKTFSRPARVFLASAALLACVLGSGCVAVVAAAGAGAAVAYVRGELKATLNADYDRALRATAKAIDELQLMKVGDQHDALVANLTLRNADDTRIKIHLQTTGSGLTELTIRVGLLGNEPLSRAIYDRILQHL